MKKVEKVSIAGLSFTLDNDAYLSLKQYLDSLHDYYDNDPDGKEIIADIEGRIAELILSEQVYTKIVSKPLVDSIISQLGTPEEIDDDNEAGERPSSSTGAGTGAEPSIPRRLYRSREGRILGGVCSGMAKFWDINVAWIRLAFVFPMALTIFSSPFHGWWWGRFDDFAEGWSWVFFLIYIVLWIATPIAKTPRQKLEARGERITPSTIRQNLQDGANTPSAKKAASVAAEIFAVLGRVMLFIVKFVVAFVGFMLLIAAFGTFVAIIMVLVNPISVGLSLVALSILYPALFVALILFCVMIPVLVVALALLGLVFNWRIGRPVFIIMLGVWLAAMVLCTVVTVNNAKYLRDEIRNGNIHFGLGDFNSDDFRWRYESDDAHGVTITIRDDEANEQVESGNDVYEEAGSETRIETQTDAGGSSRVKIRRIPE